MPIPSENENACEETSLLARIGAGDREAFRELYARFSTPLFSLALRLVGDRGEAEELLQDAFVKIWRHAADFDARKSRPFTWAVTILRRTCIDHLRKHRRAPVSAPLPDDDTASADFSPRALSPHAAEVREDAERIQAALAEISAPQRLALELALFSQLTHVEIAARLRQPVGTIKSWIRRGFLDLRATLHDCAP